MADTEDSKDFSVPDGYEEEKIDGQLCLEDLDEDSELWLIRIPCGIKLSSLDKKKVYLGSNSNEINVTSIKTENGNVLECCAENCDIANMCVVLPDKEKKLHAVPKLFKGAILISEGLNVNWDPEVTEKVEDSTADLTNISPNFNLELGKKSKKKRNTSLSENSQNLYYETEDADSVSHPVTKHKHSKKSKKSKTMYENEEIKSEPESTDIDGFPACRSQT